MNILAIGNSFSQDATRYLQKIARADGENISVINLYIGGCSLERHYRNMLTGERAYALECNGEQSGFSVSLAEALTNREWDVITLQQASHYSFDKNTYEPYISALADFVRKYQPKAKIYCHATWAYEDGSERLYNVAGYKTFESMQNDVSAAYAEFARAISADGIIPSGEIFRALLASGIPSVHRDTFHASHGLGRYALGLLWYHTLLGKKVSNNTFSDFDEPITDSDIAIVKKVIDEQF